MARTKAQCYAKAGGKASRKVSIAKPSAKSSRIRKEKEKRNSVVKRPTPKWQNPITDFFSKNDSNKMDNGGDKVDPDHEVVEEEANGTNFDEPGCSKECTDTASDEEEFVTDGECENESSADEDVSFETFIEKEKNSEKVLEKEETGEKFLEKEKAEEKKENSEKVEEKEENSEKVEEKEENSENVEEKEPAISK